MSKSKQPFMPLFFGDFLGATAEWEGEERSLYLLLLGYQWSLGSLPADPAKLRKLVGWDVANFDHYWPTIVSKFQLHGDRLMNPRLEVHRVRAIEISVKRATSGSKGGKAKGKSKRQKQTSSKSEANASGLLKQNGSNGHDFVRPSNPIQTKPYEEQEAYDGKSSS